MGELLRLLHAARRSGVLGQIMDTLEVGEQPAGMSDATIESLQRAKRIIFNFFYDFFYVFIMIFYDFIYVFFGLFFLMFFFRLNL